MKKKSYKLILVYKFCDVRSGTDEQEFQNKYTEFPLFTVYYRHSSKYVICFHKTIKLGVAISYKVFRMIITFSQMKNKCKSHFKIQISGMYDEKTQSIKLNWIIYI